VNGTALQRYAAVTPLSADVFEGAANGPLGKRAYGGLLAAQSLAAACATAPTDRNPTAVHVQFLRGGDAGIDVRYAVERTHDGRSATSRRVLATQGERLLVSATVLFAVPAAGPEHSDRAAVEDPERLPRTGPIGPAPSLPADELDIRVDDCSAGVGFVRRLWWRVTAPLPDDSRLHACIAAYVTDIYGVDPILAVHGHSMTDRSHHSATTETSLWLHRRVFADRWNLLESRSPSAASGRGVVIAGMYGADGQRAATFVQEGQAVRREPG
jgi:acyl-CoA thioesterase-2